MITTSATILAWLMVYAYLPPTNWYTPYCGQLTFNTSDEQLLGHTITSGPPHLASDFVFDMGVTDTQKAYLLHWFDLADHCMKSPDKSCEETWNMPCCDGDACKAIM